MKKIIFLLLCCGLIVCSGCSEPEPPTETPPITVSETIIKESAPTKTEAEPLTYKQQDDLLKPLNLLSPRYKITQDGTNHYIEYNEHKIRIYVYPAMWNKYYNSIPRNAIAISDKSIKYTLPKIDAIIREEIDREN